MKNSFAYIRVSTAKQGENGVSLQEQRSAIETYAIKNNMNITEWFEERATAAKNGRPVFTAMMKRLRQREVEAVIIHKIDRSARNLRDWADLGDLNDAGIEFHFAVESLDLTSRGGRLAADIQAVVAADYIRNLSMEARKGFYGRLKQGFYPLAAPIGYLDNGGGQPKTLDPVRAPIIKKAFKLYATGEHSLRTIKDTLPLTNKFGTPVSITGWSSILNNPFYYGLMHVKKTGEVFEGNHEPLITKALFDQVQYILKGKSGAKTSKHQYDLRKMFTCRHCGYSLIGEKQKGHVYYRCHSRDCLTKGFREEALNESIYNTLKGTVLRPCLWDRLDYKIEAHKTNMLTGNTDQQKSLQLNLDRVNSKLTRLSDAYLEGVFDEAEFREKKAYLSVEKKRLEHDLLDLATNPGFHEHYLPAFLELSKTLILTYDQADTAKKRKILKLTTSNRTASPKNVELEPSEPWMLMNNHQAPLCCPPQGGTPRTYQPDKKLLDKIADDIFNDLLAYFQSHREEGQAYLDL